MQGLRATRSPGNAPSFPSFLPGRHIRPGSAQVPLPRRPGWARRLKGVPAEESASHTPSGDTSLGGAGNTPAPQLLAPQPFGAPQRRQSCSSRPSLAPALTFRLGRGDEGEVPVIRGIERRRRGRRLRGARRLHRLVRQGPRRPSGDDRAEAPPGSPSTAARPGGGKEATTSEWAGRQAARHQRPRPAYWASGRPSRADWLAVTSGASPPPSQSLRPISLVCRDVATGDGQRGRGEGGGATFVAKGFHSPGSQSPICFVLWSNNNVALGRLRFFALLLFSYHCGI